MLDGELLAGFFDVDHLRLFNCVVLSRVVVLTVVVFLYSVVEASLNIRLELIVVMLLAGTNST